MSTMNISLPDALKTFLDEQVPLRSDGTSSEYVRELIRKDQDRQQLRGLLLAGASSPPAGPADAAYPLGCWERQPQTNAMPDSCSPTRSILTAFCWVLAAITPRPAGVSVPLSSRPVKKARSSGGGAFPITLV